MQPANAVSQCEAHCHCPRAAAAIAGSSDSSPTGRRNGTGASGAAATSQFGSAPQRGPTCI